MDPVIMVLLYSVGLSGASAAVAGASTWVVSRYQTRHDRRVAKRTAQRLREVSMDATRLKCHVKDHEARLSNADEKLRELTESRDKYKKIAQSHEVKHSKRDTDWILVQQKVWKERLYRDAPAKVLERLREDLKPFGDKRVVIELRMKDTGSYWRKRHKENWSESWPVATLAGPASYIPEAFERWLSSYKLFSGWKDCNWEFQWNASMKLSDVRVSVDAPQTHVVEVAVPEVQIVEREVERTRYVVWDEPTQTASVQDEAPRVTHPLDRLPKEDIRELIQDAVAVELELKEAELDRQRRQRAAQAARSQTKQL